VTRLQKKHICRKTRENAHPVTPNDAIKRQVYDPDQSAIFGGHWSIEIYFFSFETKIV
jgi:hypothetical protein